MPTTNARKPWEFVLSAAFLSASPMALSVSQDIALKCL
jgi:hypothetical protein